MSLLHPALSTSTATLAPDTLVVASREQVSCEVGGESVVLSMRSGSYFGLDPVAARIFDLVQEPTSAAAVCATLLAEYDGVTAEECTRDVLALLGQLRGWGLVDLAEPRGT